MIPMIHLYQFSTVNTKAVKDIKKLSDGSRVLNFRDAYMVTKERKKTNGEK